MAARERFHRLLRRHLSPVLRADGFQGGGNTFRRAKGDRIDLLNVQGSRYGGQCCVNLASHFLFLPTEGGGQLTDPMRFKECQCTFRDRLHEAGESDHWWPYGANDAEAEASVAHLLDLYRRRGTLFYRRVEPFPEVFERITAAEIDAGDLSKMPAAMPVVSAAVTLARIMNHLGRRDQCRAFAEVGLRHWTHGGGLKAELERLTGAS
jgi:hypothetical protein